LKKLKKIQPAPLFVQQLVPTGPAPFAPVMPTIRPLLSVASGGQCFQIVPPAFTATATQSQMSGKRTYNRRVESNVCRKCNMARTRNTGHSQYKSVIYCPNVEMLSREEWLDQIKKK
jgi:hypothetical protein